jgi:hypothetical protein
MKDAIDHTGEVFRLAFASGFYHPDPGIRDSLRRTLDAWLASLGPHPDPDAVRRLILAEKGTAIEPFVLEDADVECAVFLARAAFAGASGQNRFRLVSRDTIGSNGGLVITRNLSTYFVKRHPHNTCKGQPKGGWTFVPTLLASAASRGSGIISAVLLAENDGFRITLPLADCAEDPSAIARQMQIASRIHGVDETFDRLGLRIEFRQGTLHVLSGSPESMIRCMAWMAERTTMILEGGPASGLIPRILVRLELPAKAPTPLLAAIGCTTDYLAWFAGEVPVAPLLEEAQWLEIAKRFRPANEWLWSVFKGNA